MLSLAFRARAVGLVSVAGLVIAASIPPAYATPKDGAAPTTNEAKAQKAFEASRSLYKDGQYRAAIAKLEEARGLDPSAKELPYNLGIIHEKLGELDDAIEFFEIYVTLETDDGEKERARATIRRLEGARNDKKAAEDEAKAAAAASASAQASATPPPASASTEEEEAPPPPSKGKLDALVIGTAGGAVVALLLGTYFGIHALSTKPSNPTTSRTTSIGSLEDAASSAHESAIAADISFGIAALAAGGAAFLYFSRDADAQPRANAAFTPLKGGGFGHLQVAF